MTNHEKVLDLDQPSHRSVQTKDANLGHQPCAAGPGMSFLRHGEIYRSDVASGGGKPQGLPPPMIVAMSFPRLFLGGLLSSRARLCFTG